ncbi:bifunctional diaminohydroxyphosphoribosylaminopyrimidine deaminase/5-amino-6-(5-phosphoribosylamino)uracil reductase RibD [Synechococcus sp. A10-1-5-1]|uniref:bifunctional diaminohydroxyphosphoribosylaminopyrimidine deaminase/5-amino-6-(5-phosphoribosylamino)uracil reductase RibD n=1 Tax=Synechococcus sp. A10-1-5-1 TaxID=2936507 RepID=UPI002001D589|nr:bifunctional diaminohydroxyphosphoribosylaminopyrimidine deaminase/5-amino-6-(5-phosphoribosylamino)uracil reductase RibD [Synechococcus sp. A10-1-5-1]UPM49912.1 bifunctional diaminohydroxyphosphoribosylaminopyrimidine deaminase/5-amino-6-(5-phosphoribosylamino)uracil reductase RibD [Synechococcus sp. A10-1-5-1]
MAQPAELARRRMSSSPWRLWMQRALQLASLGAGRTSPNPLVGCVVLDAAGALVGEGFHRQAGTPHAEVHALRQAGERAQGGTAIVTLEPCCHRGRTPPCSEALIAAGVSRVVVAMPDPDPRVAGGGIAQLQAAGIKVISGVCEDQAQTLNRSFIQRVQTGRPWGILKWAMSLDGRTALPNGSSQWISGSPARAWVHQLRGQCDAVLVGGGTVRADNPLLTSRGQHSPEPLRVVLSRSLDLPSTAQLWDQNSASTLVLHGIDAPADQQHHLDRLGVEHLALPDCGPKAAMELLAERGCNQVLWECGPELAAAALRDDCVQQLAGVIAPKLLGGLAARTPLGDLGLVDVNQAEPWGQQRLRPLGDDWLIELQR